MLKRITNKLAALWQRRFYFLSKRFGASVPVHGLSWVPDSFAMRSLGRTGIRLVENFCTPEESALLIDAARSKLDQHGGGVLVNDLTVSGSFDLGGSGVDDPSLLPLLYRSALLFGVSHTHIEKLVLLRATAASEHDPVGHYAAPYSGSDQHVVLLFLNEVTGDADGETVFAGMNLAVSPRVGRAVCWTLGGGLTLQDLKLRESLPTASGAEKWVLQIWLRERALSADGNGMVNPPQARQGEALGAEDVAPDGVWSPQDIDLEAVFGQPDKMKGLL